MKNIAKFCGILLITASFILGVSAQDDESRQQSGLPTFIGNRPGANPVPGANASLQGTLTIQGAMDEEKPPSFTVSVFANGVMVGRQRIQNRGAFSFNGVPRFGVTLVIEADNLEVASYPLGTLNSPPLSNRQDVILTWLQIGQAVKRRNEVISVRNSYSRSEENQKLFDKAIDGVKEKKSENSLKLFKQLLDKDPKDYVAWTELGSIYFNNEKFSDAENAYNKAIKLKSDFLPALTNLGKLYLAQKKSDQAIETLIKAYEFSKESADINHYLGEAYLQAKKGSQAVIYLNQAIKLAPIEKAEIHLRLAALYNAAGVKDRAVTEYKMFLEKVPDYPEKSKIEKYISENSK